VPRTDFLIVWRPQAGGALAASLIDLEASAGLVEALPVPPQIAGLLRELNADGRTVVLVTHNDALAARSPRVVRLVDGRVVADERRP
jgi:ABC-type ATPase involved in cell division